MQSVNPSESAATLEQEVRHSAERLRLGRSLKFGAIAVLCLVAIFGAWHFAAGQTRSTAHIPAPRTDATPTASLLSVIAAVNANDATFFDGRSDHNFFEIWARNDNFPLRKNQILVLDVLGETISDDQLAASVSLSFQVTAPDASMETDTAYSWDFHLARSSADEAWIVRDWGVG